MTKVDDPLIRRMKQLIDKQDITDVIHCYSHALDRGDAEMMKTVFHPDAVCDLGAFRVTAEEYYEVLKRPLERWYALQHRISNILIDLHDDVALTECIVTAWHGRIDDGKRFHDFIGLRYLDRFERRAGSWRIAHRQGIYEWNLEAEATSESFFWFMPERMDDCRFSRRGEADYYYSRLKAFQPRG